ncbi:MAG: hypothetical protein DI598_01610 [Pseudopedobacter saltans]|uniref:Integrase family protein n=1 Tax=Pseudopedobacter saltans TaxID=151895 RepID=A0A2W5FEH9_9SPHI|nr:MAG: hypothetical protein DI598_01610 [Pseudopedobacter saltans]
MEIPEPRFYLKQPSSIEKTLISMQVKYCGQRVFISTGEKIAPSEWSFEKQRAIVTRRNLTASAVNMAIDKISMEFKNAFFDLLREFDIPPAKVVTDKLLQKIDESYISLLEKPVEKVTLMKFISQYIDECKGSKSVGTIKTYVTTQRHLEAFALLKNKKIDFEDITLGWRSGFVQYLQGLNMARNTEGKHIKNIKVFMNEATERGINTNLDFRSRKFIKPTEEVDKVFLTEEELQKLLDLNLEKGDKKDIVRDLFIISCYTSLRYSDLINIRQENIKEATIEMRTQKTGEDVIIPISKKVRNIFDKYDSQLPKAPCNQIFNSLLKDVCRLAGLTEAVTITKTVAGVKQTKTFEKYELISCHTGRRSMISNCILEGVPTSSIMLISAHKSLKVFQKYVRITKQQNADVLQHNIFFNR